MHPVFGKGIGRDRDNRCARAPLAGFFRSDAPRCRQAVHNRHLAVHQNNVVGIAARERNGLKAIRCDVNATAEACQKLSRHFDVDGVVFGEENAGTNCDAVNIGGFAQAFFRFPSPARVARSADSARGRFDEIVAADRFCKNSFDAGVANSLEIALPVERGCQDDF